VSISFLFSILDTYEEIAIPITIPKADTKVSYAKFEACDWFLSIKLFTAKKAEAPGTSGTIPAVIKGCTLVLNILANMCERNPTTADESIIALSNP